MGQMIVNPLLRLDVTGKLFCARDSNINIKDKLQYDLLMSRLNIEKGQLAFFPDVGLKQHLFNFRLVEEDDLDTFVNEFEQDMSNQLKQSCEVEYETDIDRKEIIMTIRLEKLKYGVQLKLAQHNNSVKIINYELME